MEADPISIHAVEMFNYGFGIRQIATAIWALGIEPLSDKVAVFLSVNFN